MAIRSVAFPDHYIGLEATGVTQFTAAGAGQVKTPTYVGTHETFLLQKNDDNTVSFKSTVFNNVYIRLDGSNLPKDTGIPSGGGVVNGQYTADIWEKFHIHKKGDEFHQYKAGVGIESAAFPGRYLRMDAHNGIVNVQGVFESLEEFEILVIG